MAKPAQKDLFAYAHDNRASLVYVITNRKNGKRYVGVTRLSLHKRAQKHIWNALKTNIAGKLYTAIRSHGPNVFAFNIFATCESYKDALAEERRLIKELNPEYNLTAGGEGVLGHRFSEESKLKMSEAAKRRGPPWQKGECPDWVREKISARRTGKPINKSERLLAACRRNSVSASLGRCRPVISLTDGIAFKSLTEAAMHYGCASNVSIIMWVNGAKPRNKIDPQLRFVEEVYST